MFLFAAKVMSGLGRVSVLLRFETGGSFVPVVVGAAKFIEYAGNDPVAFFRIRRAIDGYAATGVAEEDSLGCHGGPHRGHCEFSDRE